MPPLPRQRLYAIDDIYALPDGERAELIDGQIYNMAPLTRRHQEILSFLHAWIYNHVTKNTDIIITVIILGFEMLFC